MKNKCKDCNYQQESICIRYPPVIVPELRADATGVIKMLFYSRYPNVNENMCCGEFEAVDD
jgi:hypothetical protein